MIDLRGKRVTIAGRLTGRYAGKGVKMLGIDLGRFLGAELVRDFDPSADVAIVGEDAQRQLQRASGMTTVPEGEVQRVLVAAVERLPKPAPVDPDPNVQRSNAEDRDPARGD